MSAAKRQRRMDSEFLDSESDLLFAIAVAVRPSPQIVGLPHVLQLFMDFILSTRLKTIERANNAGLYCIVNWLLSRCDLSKMPQECRELRFYRGISGAAALGNIALVELWCAHFPIVIDGGFKMAVYQSAVRSGHVHLLKWLHSRGALGTDEATSSMITNITYSRPAVVYWLHSHFPQLRLPISIENVASRSSEDGAVEFLDWLWRRKQKFWTGHKIGAQTMAACCGNLPVLEWLHEHRVGEYRMCTLEGAAENGHFENVKWLFERRHVKINALTSPKLIVENGHFDIFNWLYERLELFGSTQIEERRKKWTFHGMRQAALQGRLVTLKLVCASALCKLNKKDMMTVALNGHVNVLKWLFKHQSWANATNGMMDCAAERGHFALVKFLRSEGKSGSTKAMDYAAANGHFDILKWLHTRRKVCCTIIAMDGVAAANRLDIVQWLHANRPEGCSTKAMDTAASYGSMEMVQWLHDHRSEGCTINAIIDAAANGHLEMVKWLHVNQSMGFSPKAFNDAASKGHLEVVQWLLEMFSPTCDFSGAKDGAIRGGHLRVVQWLHVNCCVEFTREAFFHALWYGHIATVDWLYQESGTKLKDVSVHGSYFNWWMGNEKDESIEWALAHFPSAIMFTVEVRKRIDSYLRPITYVAQSGYGQCEP